MIVPGFLEGLDLFDSEISILRTVEIKVRFIGLATPNEMMFCQHRSPGVPVMQIDSDGALVRAGPR